MGLSMNYLMKPYHILTISEILRLFYVANFIRTISQSHVRTFLNLKIWQTAFSKLKIIRRKNIYY